MVTFRNNLTARSWSNWLIGRWWLHETFQAVVLLLDE
jgi:hypothetical protein